MVHAQSKTAAHEPQHHRLTVQDLMTRDVRKCSADDNLNTAAQLMWEGDCGSLPVVDANSKVVGMLTDRDICMAAYIKGASLATLPVAAAMSRTVFSVKPDDSVHAAVRLMAENQVRRLPVIGPGGRLAGILSLNDLAREAAREQELGRKQFKPEEVTSAMAAISAPRWPA